MLPTKNFPSISVDLFVQKKIILREKKYFPPYLLFIFFNFLPFLPAKEYHNLDDLPTETTIQYTKRNSITGTQQEKLCTDRSFYRFQKPIGPSTHISGSIQGDFIRDCNRKLFFLVRISTCLMNDWDVSTKGLNADRFYFR